MLAGEREGLDVFTFAAHEHVREALVPLAVGNFRLTVGPAHKEHELVRKNPAALEAIEEVLKKFRRQIVPPNVGHFRSEAGALAVSRLLTRWEIRGLVSMSMPMKTYWLALSARLSFTSSGLLS